MRGHTALQKGLAKANNALRGVFMDPDVTITLLKPADDENEYEALLELEKDWFLFGNGRRVLFEISRDDDQLTDAMDAATHIAVDNSIFRIVDGNELSDEAISPPIGINVMWRFYADRFDGSRHFTILR